jgi:hypothetical protein
MDEAVNNADEDNSSKVVPSKDYEVCAKEAPITEFDKEIDFPVAPVAVVRGDNVSLEPMEKEITLEEIEREISSEEAFEQDVTLEEEDLNFDEPKIEDHEIEEPVSEAVKEKPVERKKPSYDVSKVVFSRKKKKPVKFNAKVVTKVVKATDDSKDN